jgi:hypothetical protein
MPKIDSRSAWGDTKPLDASRERVIGPPARPLAVEKRRFFEVLIFSQLPTLGAMGAEKSATLMTECKNTGEKFTKGR